MIWFLAFTARMTSFWLNNLWDLRPILCDKQPEEVIYAFVKDHRFCWMHALLWNILGEARDECLYFLLLSVAFLILFCVIFFKSLHISPLSHVTCTLFDYNHTIFSHLSNVPFLFFSFSFFYSLSGQREPHQRGFSESHLSVCISGAAVEEFSASGPGPDPDPGSEPAASPFLSETPNPASKHHPEKSHCQP